MDGAVGPRHTGWRGGWRCERWRTGGRGRGTGNGRGSRGGDVVMSEQGRRYRVILADPPWAYSVYGGKHRYVSDTVAGARLRGNGAAIAHYQTASVDEIATLPVAALAAKDCALFMWATYPCLPEAMHLMRAWGFTYKTAAFT